jgi:hypothetical protein
MIRELEALFRRELGVLGIPANDIGRLALEASRL